jgi:antitoxin (DNA-binding transcriptional repressor) of toxin-antitoxin stability system
MKRDNMKKPRGRERGTKATPRVRAAYSVKGSRVISATEAARAFSELLDRVCYRGETFVIERGGEPVCEMSHVKPLRFTGTDFLTLLHSLPKPDPGFWDAVEDATKQEPAVPKSPWER